MLENRIIRRTLSLLLRVHAWSPRVRVPMDHHERQMAEVRLQHIDDRDFDDVHFTRLNERYRTPLALARLGPVEPYDIDIAVVGAPPGAATGSVEVLVEAGEELDVGMVTFYIDGEFRAVTNVAPYRYQWNTGYAEPGVHEIRVEAMNRYQNPIAEKTVSVIVAE